MDSFGNLFTDFLKRCGIAIFFHLPFKEPFKPWDNTSPLSNGGKRGSTKMVSKVAWDITLLQSQDTALNC